MPLPGLFPIYPDKLLVGPYHVSLSLPGVLSEISKSVSNKEYPAGITSSTSFLIPNVDFLENFIKGDIGLGSNVMKSMISKNFSSPIAAKDEEVFKAFAKLNKVEIDDINKYKKDGRFVMPKDEIKLDPSLDMIGIKSIEKTTLTSIYETQKPYMEIAKYVIENLASIEDIVARVMPLVSISPLTSKSEKPVTNAGDGKTKAKSLGYKNGEELKEKLAKMESFLDRKENKVQKEIDFDVVNSYFDLNKNTNIGASTRQLRESASKISIVLEQLSGRGDLTFDRVYQIILKNNGTNYTGEILDFLNADKFKNGFIYNTNQKLSDVSLTINDINEIVQVALGKFKFRNNVNITNQEFTRIYINKLEKLYQKIPNAYIETSPNKKDDNGKQDDPRYEIISEVYSTGEFDPSVEYAYDYIDLPADDKLEEKKSDLDLQKETDPYHKYKPKKLIFGIFDSEGKPLNPTQKIKTIGLVGNSVVETNTPFKKADWILRSEKWYLPTGVYQWPSYGDPVYVWEKGINRRESKSNPDPDASNPPWRIKKYKEGDKDLISKEDALPGNPMIVRFETNQELEYRDFFTDYVKFNFFNSDLQKDTKLKRQYTNDIMSQIEIQTHLQNVFLYGQSKSYYERINGKDPIPFLLKKSFKPYQIFSTKAAVDDTFRNFSASEGIEPGFIWIEPEADYDMKIIRVDPSSKIEYVEAQEEPEVNAEIDFFIKNRIKFSLDTGEPFSVSVSKNGSSFDTLENVTEYSFDNWNYENARVFNSNSFRFSVWSDRPFRIGSSNAQRANDGYWYELINENGSWYYRKFKFKIDAGAIALQALLAILSPQLLIYLYALWLVNKAAEYTFNGGDDGEGGSLSFTVKLNDLFPKREYYSIESGDVIINNIPGFERRVRLDSNGKIIRWYYLYNRLLEGPSNKVPEGQTRDVDRTESFGNNDYLPTFGVIRNFIMQKRPNNKEILPSNPDIPMIYSDESTTLYNIRINTDDEVGSIIDPSKITNNRLTTEELFVDIDGSSDQKFKRYGHGAPDFPQQLKVLKRYKLTDLDTESYFIIEGTLRNPPKDDKVNEVLQNQNTQNNATVKEWYVLPDAIGAFKPFLSMLVNVFAKLIPAITKLLNLLKNPAGFLTDIIGEKMQDNILFLSKQTLATFKEGLKIKNGLQSIDDFFKGQNTDGNGILNLEQLKSKLPADGISFNPSIKDLKNSEKLNTKDSDKKDLSSPISIGGLNDKLTSISKISSPIDTSKISNERITEGLKKEKVKQLKEHFKNSNLSNYVYVSDDGNPISILDGFANIPFNIFGKSIPIGMNLEIASIDKPPLNLFMDPKISNVKNLHKQLINKTDTREGRQPNIKDFQTYNDESEEVQIKFNDGSSTIIESSSLDEFVIDNNTRYNLLYTNAEIESKILESGKLIERGDEGSLSRAKSKLQDVLKQRPNDLETQDKIKDIDSKLGLLKSGQQPLLKMLLGLVTTPVKIVAGIIEYLLSFFKGLANPVKLPGKVVELLSFEWLFRWFIPPADGKHPLLEIAGIKFDLKKELEWKAQANVPGPPTDKLPSSLKLPEDIKAKGFNFNDIKAGNYLSGDDKPFADMSEALNVAFNIKLPKLTALQFRQSQGVVSNVITGFLCFIEKLLNSFIDFFWSLLGLESLKEAPHIKLCGENDEIDKSKLVNNDKEQNLENFIYEIQISDGTIMQFQNREELDKFIEENKDISYDFNF